MGDEVADSYYFCEECGLYTVEVRRDRFLGPEEVSHRGPLSKDEGDEKIRLIEGCPEPWEKKCRCPVHLTYFEGWLD